MLSGGREWGGEMEGSGALLQASLGACLGYLAPALPFIEADITSCDEQQWLREGPWQLSGNLGAALLGLVVVMVVVKPESQPPGAILRWLPQAKCFSSRILPEGPVWVFSRTSGSS